MSERDGFLDRLTLGQALSEIERLDAELSEARRIASDSERMMTQTLWMLLWSVPTHQIRVTSATQEDYGSGRPLLDRQDDARDGSAIFTARLLP